MTTSLSLSNIHLKRIFFFMMLILIPNLLVMRLELAGPIDDRIGTATAIDLGIILPLLLYFFGFKTRASWIVLPVLLFIGVLLANLIIPSHADGYLSYFNHSVIVLEAAVISFELLLLLIAVRKVPLFIRNYKAQKKERYHFLASFSAAVDHSFSFKRVIHVQKVFHVLAVDLSAFYYSLFSWRKQRPDGYTFHQDGAYTGVFFMLVHAMLIEIIAVHLMVAQFSHTAAWIVTALDVYALLFIIADYQAIRLSPIVLDRHGIHFQKGIRAFGSVPWEKVEGLYNNDQPAEADSIELAFYGLEKETPPYVIRLKDPVTIRRPFGMKKNVTSIYLKVDDAAAFQEAFHKKGR
ncbi:hypothetical protein [Halobacillus kuroshimensis]|uniref:hypothetical protein n=1 Tax=Halobacillus kuroshimensis TaxID=302481 RepID=UPI0003F78744|nr:hypothetical protein [Halobacillus kuroshimensis]